MKIIVPALICIIVAIIDLTIPASEGAAARWLTPANIILVVSALYLFGQGLAHAKYQKAHEATCERLRQLESAIALAEKKAGELSLQLEAFHRETQEKLERAEVAAKDQCEASVLSFISLLQDKGRFIDFLMDDITSFDDRQVGAAARVVHQGCNEIVNEYFDIVPVRDDIEGHPVTIRKDESANLYRFVGKITGQPPLQGTLLHRGWKTKKVALPKMMGTGPRDVIAPAEIEIT